MFWRRIKVQLKLHMRVDNEINLITISTALPYPPSNRTELDNLLYNSRTL